MTGTPGTTVQISPREISGHHCTTPGTSLATTITESGKATITLQYALDAPAYGMYYITGSDYMSPQTGPMGTPVTTLENPTKVGYTFAGWDTNEDGVADALPSTIPEGGIVTHALWKPAEVEYQINYYGGAESASGGYMLIKQETGKGFTGSTTEPAPKPDTSDIRKENEWRYYQHTREDEPQVIKADGTTVVNVYYDWKPVTVHIVDWISNGDNYQGFPDIVHPKTGQYLYTLIDLPVGRSGYYIHSMGE